MPSVVMFAPSAPSEPGGVARASLRIAEQAARRGEEVHLVCWSKHAPPGACATRRSTTDVGALYEHHVGRQGDAERDLMALTDHGANVAERSSASLVHAIYGSSAGYAGVLAAQLAALPSVLSLRGNDVDRGLFRADQLPLLSHAVTRASVVSAVSRELQRKAGRAFGREVIHVTNSVDTQVFKPEAADNSLRASLGLTPGAPVIGFMGELREKKGMRYLLPAFAELSHRQTAHLLLIGGLRADAREAYEHFRETAPEAAQHIHLLDYAGSPKRLCRLLALCDLMVFPSLFEGTPNAVLEAMAAGRPVLATRVGGHLDLIDHDATGALIDLHDLDQLPDAIEECLSSERRASWGANARAFVAREHLPEQESAAYQGLYARARGLGSELG
ncbi:MAG: glycosyltransferase family 4 protein [Polyangiaceae bacterium]|nr:glycosyltransferase family 4 protein [Polyangiaceae bacterium]MCW5789521.1 glycosyltransferase family 4 protein [Polyangiaceae bacterium]